MKFQASLSDKCPVCKKKVKTMLEDHKALITVPLGIVCPKCGCHFAVQDMISKALHSKDHQIVLPGEENQEAFSVVRPDQK